MFKFNIIYFDKIKRKLRKYIYNPNKQENDKEYLIKLGRIHLGYRMNLDDP